MNKNLKEMIKIFILDEDKELLNRFPNNIIKTFKSIRNSLDLKSLVSNKIILVTNVNNQDNIAKDCIAIQSSEECGDWDFINIESVCSLSKYVVNDEDYDKVIDIIHSTIPCHISEKEFWDMIKRYHRIMHK